MWEVDADAEHYSPVLFLFQKKKVLKSVTIMFRAVYLNQ
jgi:hypothetical protein